MDERISDWLLAEAPGQLPDRVLRTTFERTRPIHQRRTLLGSKPFPWLRFGSAAIAVGVAIVVAIVGFVLLPSSTPSVGGPNPASTPSSPSIEPSLAPVTGLPGRFAFASNRDGDYDIYVMNPDRTALLQLTDAPGEDVAPIWSRDGARLAFASNRDGDYDLYLINADGTAEEQIANIAGDQFPGGWSSGDERLAYSTAINFGTSSEGTAVRIMNADGSGQVDVVATGDQGVQFVTGGLWLASDSSLLVDVDKSTTGGEMDIYRLDLGDGNLTALTSYPGDDNSAALSPDESKIAFQSDRDGGCVYVMDVDGIGVVQLTTGCRTGFPISWSPDGAWIGWAGDRPKAGPADIHVIDAIGGSVVQLTDTSDIVDLAWGPGSP